MDIMDKGFVSYSTDEHMTTSYRDSLSELLFSFVPKKYVSAMYADWDPFHLKRLVFCIQLQ